MVVLRRGRGVESDGTVPGSRHNERFPGYDVLGEIDTWDAVTAGVVLARLGPPPPIRFFTPAEQATAAALFDQLLDQRDDPKVPVLQLVDARLTEDLTDGYHYATMPPDEEAWRRTLAFLDDDAVELCGAHFHELTWQDQTDVVDRVQKLSSDGKQWHGLPAEPVWSLWTRYACAAFYSHPWAWNEIGYGGPAYPRGYKNAGIGKREPWEVADDVDRDPVAFGNRVEQARRGQAEARGVE